MQFKKSQFKTATLASESSVARQGKTNLTLEAKITRKYGKSLLLPLTLRPNRQRRRWWWRRQRRGGQTFFLVLANFYLHVCKATNVGILKRHFWLPRDRRNLQTQTNSSTEQINLNSRLNTLRRCRGARENCTIFFFIKNKIGFRCDSVWFVTGTWAVRNSTTLKNVNLKKKKKNRFELCFINKKKIIFIFFFLSREAKQVFGMITISTCSNNERN